MKHLAQSKAKPQLKFEAIGTAWEISADAPIATAHADHITQLIAKFDKQYSRFRNDSWVSELSRKSGTYGVPPDAQQLFDLYYTLYTLTDGLVTPLIAGSLSDAGYDASYRLQARDTIQTPPTWDEVLQYKYPKLTVRQPVLLDVGAAGKGYLADIVLHFLKDHYQEVTVNAGGDIVQFSRSQQPLRIALEDPNDPTQAIGVATIHNQSLCGSAHHRRSWQQYSHILSPKTLDSPKHIQAVWVVAESGLIADGLSTALFFVPPTKLSSHFDFEYVIMNADRTVQHSSNFPGELFT